MDAPSGGADLTRMVTMALLVISVLLPIHVAQGQARQPLPAWNDLAGPPVEPGIWLSRLVGRFSFEGLIHVPRLGDCGEDGAAGRPVPCQTVKGMGDCVGIGTGPGVQCVLDVSWPDIYSGTGAPAAVAYLAPAMVLFGLDPRSGAINHLVVNNKGLAEGGLGANAGNRATFRTSCVNDPGVLGGCQRIFRIEAAADSRLLYMWIDVERGSGLGPPDSSIVLSLRRMDPGLKTGLEDRLGEVTSEESDEEVARAEEDAREELAARALETTSAPEGSFAPEGSVATEGSGGPESPSAPEDPRRQPAQDTRDETELDEVMVERERARERERQRQAQAPRLVAAPDNVTVTRNTTRTGGGAVRVRVLPWTPQREIPLRASDARQLARGEDPRLVLQPDRLTLESGKRIRSATLEFTAGVDEADGLPALIPFNATTSLFNYDYARLRDSTQPLVATLRNVLDPETRRCTSALRLGDGAEEFRDRFVLLGDRFADCNRTVNSRDGDLLFADAVPQRLRQELQDIYDPVNNRFARNLGSEPGIVFVVWRPESPRNDFRFVHGLNRTGLLVFNGPSWEQGLPDRQRDALWEYFAQDQIKRRMAGGGVIVASAADYLLQLAGAEHQQRTGPWLTAELPKWIAACTRAMSVGPGAFNAPRENANHDCWLVVQFVYDAVARAKSKGEVGVMRTWRELLADAYRGNRNTVPSRAFLDSSSDAHRIVQGLLGGTVDWPAFVAELGTIGVQLRMSPGQRAPVQVQSLEHFRD